MPITQFLERNAEQWPNDVALVELNPDIKVPKLTTWKEYELIQPLHEVASRQEITWAVFNEKANRVANMLIARGIVKGDKVAILLMNCLDWLPIYFGILKTGAIAVPLNFRYSADEIEYCVKLAEADVLIFGPEFIGRVEEIADSISRRRLLLYDGPGCPSFAEDFVSQTANYSSIAPNVEVTDEDYGAIYFSSGTTGFPKAILHTHAGIMHAAIMEQKHHGQQKDDCFLCIPPLYHTGAKMHWFGSLVSGGKAVLLRGTTPETILKAVSDEKCTVVWLLVPWAQDILDSLDNGSVKKEDYCLDQWRLMHIGAIGKPGYMWECRIVDENRKDVAPGDVGELAVKGPGVMVCYYNNPEATKEVLDDDRWLYTGDMAIQDEDGFIFLVDRKKDVIISGGENLYPVQIEDFLHTFEPINDVAVIGLPDKRLGEIATAIIQLKEGFTCTEQDVNDYCKKLPRYKRPRKIIFAEVPRNPTGKIEKPKLREQYGAAFLVASENEVKK